MLHELVESGNTVVVIEHNLEVIKTADWIIDLGPEGGDGGGEIVFAGPPEEIVREEQSYTGRFLKPVLGRKPRGCGTRRRGKGGGRRRRGEPAWPRFITARIRDANHIFSSCGSLFQPIRGQLRALSCCRDPSPLFRSATAVARDESPFPRVNTLAELCKDWIIPLI